MLSAKRLSFVLAALMLFPAAPAWSGESEGTLDLNGLTLQRAEDQVLARSGPPPVGSSPPRYGRPVAPVPRQDWDSGRLNERLRNSVLASGSFSRLGAQEALHRLEEVRRAVDQAGGDAEIDFMWTVQRRG